jgi:hypothetical protein
MIIALAIIYMHCCNVKDKRVELIGVTIPYSKASPISLPSSDSSPFVISGGSLPLPNAGPIPSPNAGPSPLPGSDSFPFISGEHFQSDKSSFGFDSLCFSLSDDDELKIDNSYQRQIDQMKQDARQERNSLHNQIQVLSADNFSITQKVHQLTKEIERFGQIQHKKKVVRFDLSQTREIP